MIRPATPADASAICSIYNHYIENTVITFEEDPLTEDEMAERIRTYSEKYTYIVYEEDGEVIGYAYGSSWRTRRAYRFSTETTVYLKDGADGKRIGTLLYSELIERLKGKGFHALIGCITLPNEKSVKLHEKMGFKKVAHFHEAGWKFDQWLDVGFWEKLV
jgi:phosphinothricin acetyltransferase